MWTSLDEGLSTLFLSEEGWWSLTTPSCGLVAVAEGRGWHIFSFWALQLDFSMMSCPRLGSLKFDSIVVMKEVLVFQVLAEFL